MLATSRCKSTFWFLVPPAVRICGHSVDLDPLASLTVLRRCSLHLMSLGSPEAAGFSTVGILVQL